MIIIFCIFIGIILIDIVYNLLFKSNNTSIVDIEEKSSLIPIHGKPYKVFIHNWTLLEFAQKHGEMKVGKEIVQRTGEQFDSCRFIKGTHITFVGFYSRLGILSAEQIKMRKKELYVGQRESGNYYLHDGRIVKEEPVDLFADNYVLH